MAEFNLPDLHFADRDSSTILSEIISVFEGKTGLAVEPADPVYSFLSSIAYIITVQRGYIDKLAKMTFLAYMTGDKLDHWGANFDCERIPAKHAGTTLRFNLSQSLESIVIIPAGTRVQTAGGITFETDDVLNISAGSEYGIIHATCTESGTIGNGFVEGQVSYLMDPIAGVETTVFNITQTDGGADMEDDDSYRQRLHEAPSSFSVAGSISAYEYWAKTASTLITDVKAYSPSPGMVDVVVLTASGTPSNELLQQVSDIVSADEVRPLTDFVTVKAPEAQTYLISMKYWIDASKSIQQDNIISNVNKAIDSYIEWQTAKLGRGIDPSELIKLVKNAGAKRVEVYSPSHIPISEYKYAKLEGSPEVIYGGLE